MGKNWYGRINVQLESTAKAREGYFSILFLALWGVIFIIMGTCLWMQNKKTKYLQEQKTLDQCVYGILQDRCLFLSRISTTNKTLQSITNALFLLKTGKAVTVLVPGLQIVAATSQAIEVELKLVANQIKIFQDAAIQLHKTKQLQQLYCLSHAASFNNQSPILKRQIDFKSSYVGTPGTVSWINAFTQGEVSIQSNRLPTKSFGHCLNTKPMTKALLGESYEITLNPAKSLLKPFSSLQSQSPSQVFSLLNTIN